MASPAAEGRAGARLVPVLVVAAIVLALDQLTKWWALATVSDRTIDVVWTLRLHVTHNTGAAFSLFAGSGIGPLIALVAVGIVGVLLWQGRFVTSRVGTVALGMVLGGAVGNLIDRVFRGDGVLDGAVVDFIDLQWWPVFNVADAAVVVGSILLVGTFAFGGDGGDGEDAETAPATAPSDRLDAASDAPAGTDAPAES
ncbi:MAG: signal peptidase II [Acidimicrobiales bacterium]|nr:signal peptidase II [Acidimicrobiales bacterium]